MRAWCPRCDAVRPGATACPVCATPLATLDDAAPVGRRPELPPPEEAATPPAAPSRLRIALAAATLVVAGLSFVAGRSVARPPAPAAAPAPAPATSTTVPEPGADRRRLGWTARAGKLEITAVEANRFATDEREMIAEIRFRIRGLPADQLVLALRGLRLLDTGGGVFASVEHRTFGTEGGVPAMPAEPDPGAYTILTGPAPRLSSLARIELASLLVLQPRDKTIALDTAGPWPAAPTMRAVDPGPRDAVLVGRGFEMVQGVDLQLRVTSAFVRQGRAVVVVDASSGFRGLPGEFLPLSAELRAGDRVLCTRTSLLGGDGNQEDLQGIVLSCPARPTPRLTVALGVGARTVPADATLRP